MCTNVFDDLINVNPLWAHEWAINSQSDMTKPEATRYCLVPGHLMYNP